MTAADIPRMRRDWLTTARRYLVAVTAGTLVWEMAQMPLYTLWRTGTAREIAWAILHCTLGDLAIAMVTLIFLSPTIPCRNFFITIKVTARLKKLPSPPVSR